MSKDVSAAEDISAAEADKVISDYMNLTCCPCKVICSICEPVEYSKDLKALIPVWNKLQTDVSTFGTWSFDKKLLQFDENAVNMEEAAAVVVAKAILNLKCY